MKKTLIMMCGIPASGKSTVAQKLKNRLPNTKYFSLDEMRKWLLGTRKNQSKNRLIFKITMDMTIYYFYVIGDIVIYDATNIIPRQRKNVVKYLAYKGFSPNIYCIYLDTTPEIAKDRNRARDEEERVPDSVIDSMAQRFTPPTATEEFNGQYIFQDIYKIYPETLDNSVDIVYDILTKQRER